jgi:hypothetical protein
MSGTETCLPAETGSTEVTRFNALRHGVLSRYTVLPWEDGDEYREIVAALVAEHAPQGPTEEHLVEELAGILCRKRRLRLAEAAARRHGLNGTLATTATRRTWRWCISITTNHPRASPKRSPSRPEAGTHAFNVAASQGPTAGSGFWVIRLAKHTDGCAPGQSEARRDAPARTDGVPNPARRWRS